MAPFGRSGNVTSIQTSGADKVASFTTRGGEQTATGEKVLMAVGRQAVTEGLGLEGLGVALDRSCIKVNEHMLTSVPGIYAVGDVVIAIAMEATGKDLAHTIHAHPTLSEVVMEAALAAEGGTVHL
ncbi:MAG: FAD-dependent oxidoreductase [Chloroflexota bacterium]